MLSLISGQEITDVVFRLVRAGVGTGRVVDDTREPMIGVNVTVLDKPSEEELEDAGPRARKLEMVIASAGIPTIEAITACLDSSPANTT